MNVPFALALILIIAGVWTLVVWAVLLRRATTDPRARNESGRATTFMVTQLWLGSVSMILGAATLVIGVRALL